MRGRKETQRAKKRFIMLFSYMGQLWKSNKYSDEEIHRDYDSNPSSDYLIVWPRLFHLTADNFHKSFATQKRQSGGRST